VSPPGGARRVTPVTLRVHTWSGTGRRLVIASPARPGDRFANFLSGRRVRAPVDVVHTGGMRDLRQARTVEVHDVDLAVDGVEV
jgi:hypothetical protein